MNEMIELLHTRGYSCVIVQGDEWRTFTRRGVADLYDLVYEIPCFLAGAWVADKVIGKGAAALLIQGGAVRVHADVMSESALRLFDMAGVEAKAVEVVPHIANRDQSDRCPLEKRCDSTDSIVELLPIIDEFVAMIRSASSGIPR